MTKIDIISGFLGAGKTTFIKKLLEEAFSGEKIVLIENEFGEVGVDGGFLKDAGIEKIYNGHFSYEPIPVSMLDTMVEAMELIVAGKLEGIEVENHAGKGLEYSHNGWKVICPLNAQ